MSFKGYTSFVKKHLKLRSVGVVWLGLGLPAMAGWMTSTGVGSKVMSYVDAVPGMNTTMGRAASALALTAGVTYLAHTSLGIITPAEALTANMIALGLVTAGVLKNSGMVTGLPVVGSMVSALPEAGFAGIGSSYGYIGNYSAGAGVGAEMLPQPREQQLFGVRANVF
jgi:Na+/phosphate symporter